MTFCHNIVLHTPGTHSLTHSLTHTYAKHNLEPVTCSCPTCRRDLRVWHTPTRLQPASLLLSPTSTPRLANLAANDNSDAAMKAAGAFLSRLVGFGLLNKDNSKPDLLRVLRGARLRKRIHRARKLAKFRALDEVHFVVGNVFTLLTAEVAERMAALEGLRDTLFVQPVTSHELPAAAATDGTDRKKDSDSSSSESDDDAYSSVGSSRMEDGVDGDRRRGSNTNGNGVPLMFLRGAGAGGAGGGNSDRRPSSLTRAGSVTAASQSAAIAAADKQRREREEAARQRREERRLRRAARRKARAESAARGESIVFPVSLEAVLSDADLQAAVGRDSFAIQSEIDVLRKQLVDLEFEVKQAQYLQGLCHASAQTDPAITAMQGLAGSAAGAVPLEGQ